MPRIPRAQKAGFVFHVINRRTGRATIFHKAQDYQAFLFHPRGSKPVKMFAFPLMPNHFHFLIEASHKRANCFNSSASESSKTFWRTRLADDDCRSIWT